MQHVPMCVRMRPVLPHEDEEGPPAWEVLFCVWVCCVFGNMYTCCGLFCAFGCVEWPTLNTKSYICRT